MYETSSMAWQRRGAVVTGKRKDLWLFGLETKIAATRAVLRRVE